MKAPSASAAPIILIGFMGCGKSSVGKRLAKALHRPFIDLDARIEARENTSIAEIFSSRGEAEFRRIETEVLLMALQETGVIATGGGIVTQQANRELLQNAGAPVVYLRSRPATLARRIRRQPGVRPLIDGGSTLNLEQTTARAQELLQTRAPFYEACASVTVDTDDRTLDSVTNEILNIVTREA
jgi:shikimate kinase